MKNILIFLGCLFLAAPLRAQKKDLPQATLTLPFYWVEFEDKRESPYSIDRPEQFLSPKAIARRAKSNIPITEEDFPVNPHYLTALRKKGANILHSSRWLNAATFTTVEDSLAVIKQLPFVRDIHYVGLQYRGGQGKGRAVNMDSLMSKTIPGQPYGHGDQQITQINGKVLHEQGFDGDGVLVAVLDGGFTGVDQSPVFAPLRREQRLLPGYDFVDQDNSVYESSSHGTRVLSTMAAEYPELLVGTAPKATYVCIKTEDVTSEHLLEECHWVAGIEWADSLGADIVTSSLGYTRFDDTAMNHDKSELDGMTSVASQAAGKAASKGIFVLNSAGNEGTSDWRVIGIPADVPSTLTVGATDLRGKLARFSSVGPTADGRIKPDIVAPGASVTLADAFQFRISRGSGTSFSTPIVSGMVACLKQAFPNTPNEAIMDAIRQSGSLADEPNNEWGYGIPDFGKAYLLLAAGAEQTGKKKNNKLQNRKQRKAMVKESKKLKQQMEQEARAKERARGIDTRPTPPSSGNEEQ